MLGFPWFFAFEITTSNVTRSHRNDTSIRSLWANEISLKETLHKMREQITNGILIALLTWTCLPVHAQHETSSRSDRSLPNILVFIGDDIGCEDLEPYGNRYIRTPNMSRIASEGMTFTNAFLTTSQCSPTRASILTGKYPHNTGAANLHEPLPAGELTISEIFREMGYYTASAGKWHLGDSARSKFDTVCEMDHPYRQTCLPGKFICLPPGEIRPEGWIKAQLMRDLETGFTGHLDSLTHWASDDIFGEGKITGLRRGEDGGPEHIPKSWWPGETIPVWLDGYVRAAFLTGHPGAIAKMHAFIQHILDYQEENGYIGIYLPEVRYNHTTENAELWAQSRIFRVMLAYYEFSGDRRVLAAVRKAVDLTMDHYGPGRSYFSVENGLGGVSHGLMFTDILEWLYRLTGDGRYIIFGEFLYQDYTNFEVDRLNDARIDYLLDPEREIVGHTPHIAEHLRVPAWLFHATGTQKYRRAYETGYAKLEKYMVPSGAVHSGHREDVEGSPPTPEMPYEYCGITELLNTQKFLLEKTGETRYANMAEKLVLNAAQGARLPDGTCVTYFSRDNRYKATPEGSGGRFKFSPTHEDVAVCCNPNASKLMPYFVDGMWMKKTGKSQGLVNMFYGPVSLETTINGSSVSIRQETHFPFSDNILFRVEPEKQIPFEIWLRIPDWCDKMSIKIEEAEISERDGFKIIHRSWSPGDSFRVTFAAGIRTIEAVNGEIAFQRGPLLYSLPIPHELKRIKSYPVIGFADYEFTPAGDDLWNLRLNKAQLQNGTSFIHEYTGTSDSFYPWDGTPSLLKGHLYDPQGKSREVKLVPMGTTILRRLTFPVN
jgi:DUF1680 family protein